MQWTDRVYGESRIDDPDLLALIACPTFQRLKGVRQAGPSALAFPFKAVTRFEHSLGVFLLLRRLGADRREQVAGLLHDLSHTAFSHAVDFLYDSDEQNHHESIKSVFLDRPDVVAALGRLGYRPEQFVDDAVYPLLERPLPWLCADRLDYFFRDSLACRVSSPEVVSRLLAKLDVVGSTIVFTDAAAAREAAGLFAVMNREWWASPTEAYIYNEFAAMLRIAFDTGVLVEDDLMTDDARVLAKLYASGDPTITDALSRIERFDPGRLADYVPRVIPKVRWLDPPVKTGSSFTLLSRL
ncbi:HD domain-containing protein [Tautonia plasticadhaerens]|uniref:HD domain protein n=1 Tax=Tautonia plasticadhaerens TaxID=2527974 RepID=A0A518GYY4_9BACT|nr:HD domain-containing protein [Tautonia plasticadhaerens]QDV33799.1 HD domain protein [Tautonia plasticadhaerens]